MTFMWAAGASILSALGSANAASKQNKALAKQNIAENEAIIKANVANTIRTGYRVGMANVQRGLTKRLMQQKGFDTSAVGQQVLGAQSANAAASGTIGASVDAIQTDIRMKLGEAQAQLREDYEIEELNFNAQLNEIIAQGQNTVQSASKLKLQSSGDIRGNALLAGLTTFGSMYAQSKFDLGLGERAVPSNTAWLGNTSGLRFNAMN